MLVMCSEVTNNLWTFLASVEDVHKGEVTVDSDVEVYRTAEGI